MRDDAILHVESNGDIFAGGSGILEGQEFGESTGRIPLGETVDGFGGAMLTDVIGTARDIAIKAEVFLALHYDGCVGRYLC